MPTATYQFGSAFNSYVSLNCSYSTKRPIIMQFSTIHDLCFHRIYREFGKSLCTYKRCWKWCPRASVQVWTRLTHWGQGHLNCLNARYRVFFNNFNLLNAELNPICYLLALLAHHFLHVSRIMVKSLKLRLLMSYIYIYMYIYGAPILDVSRSHTTTQHSR